MFHSIRQQIRKCLRKFVYFSRLYKPIRAILYTNEQIKATLLMLPEKKGYIWEAGFLRSFRTKRPLSVKGEDIPWLTYPFIDFIGERLQPSFRLFEFGAGASTRYYARHVASVDTVEHNSKWVPKLTEEEKKKIQVYIRPPDQASYTNILSEINKEYHIIVVDAIEFTQGHARLACLKSAINHLTEDGVIILDDTEDPIYQKSKLFIKEKGFRHIDFYGPKALVYTGSCTTIYYRPGNCLQI